MGRNACSRGRKLTQKKSSKAGKLLEDEQKARELVLSSSQFEVLNDTICHAETDKTLWLCYHLIRGVGCLIKCMQAHLAPIFRKQRFTASLLNTTGGLL